MTVEQKCFIRAEDILSIEYECGSCGVKTTVPVRQNTRAVPKECPTCGVGWLGYDTAEIKTVSRFVGGLHELSDVLEGRGFKLSLEIKYPAEKK